MARGIKSLKQEKIVGSKVYLLIDQWIEGSSSADKNGDITWFCFAQNKKNLLDKRTLNAKDSYIITIPPKLSGSYKYYVEASLGGTKEIGKDPGLFVYGKVPKKVVSSKWCKTPDGEDCRKTYAFSYGHLIYLGLNTEGLNGDKVIVDVYRTKQGGQGTDDDQHIFTYTDVPVIDGEINLKIGNTYRWFVKIKKPKSIEEFYVRVKSAGHLVSDGKSTVHARFLRIKNAVVSKVMLPPTNHTPTKVGKPEVSIQKYEPCRYDKITINDEDSYKDSIDSTIYDPLQKKNITKYETLAKSNEKKKSVGITFDKITNKGCISKVHKKEIEIFIDGVKQKTEVVNGNNYTLPIQAKANTLLLRSSPDLFFITPDPPKIYKIILKTCAQPNNPFSIYVYPEVEREVAFILTYFKSRVKEINVKKNKGKEGYNIGRNGSLTEYSGDKKLKLVDKEWETLTSAKGGLSFGMQAKVKVDNIISSIELGTTKNQIKELLAFYNKIQYYLKEFDGRGKEGKSLGVRMGTYPKATFEIEAPNVALAIRLTNKKLKSAQVVAEYSGGLAFRPIIGFKVGVDILTLVQYLGVQGKIVNWIIEKTTQLADLEIYFILDFGIQARGEFNIAYNKIEKFKGVNGSIAVEALITGKVGMKSKTKVVVTIVSREGGQNTGTDTSDVEKWKEEGSITASFLYTGSINADNKGLYRKHSAGHNGVKATLVLYAIGSGKKYNVYTKKDFTIIPKPDKPWWDPNKTYF